MAQPLSERVIAAALGWHKRALGRRPSRFGGLRVRVVSRFEQPIAASRLEGATGRLLWIVLFVDLALAVALFVLKDADPTRFWARVGLSASVFSLVLLAGVLYRSNLLAREVPESFHWLVWAAVGVSGLLVVPSLFLVLGALATAQWFSCLVVGVIISVVLAASASARQADGG